MSNLIQHPYHMVNESPWPIMSSIFALNITIGLLMWFYINSIFLLLSSLFFILLTAMLWWEDVSREATFQGLHTSIVVLGLRWGMILFISSEVFFFLSFFWAFFHSSLAPNVEIGSHWPPLTIPVFNPLGVPLLNTIILVSSGVSITYSHKSLENNSLVQSKYYLFITIVLGVYFTMVQGLEYLDAPFTMSDSIYGATFFIATGFHGLHVIVGSIFLIVCLIRVESGSFSQLHHFGFVAAIWYWHFVDIVWLFLFFWIYVWGASINLFC